MPNSRRSAARRDEGEQRRQRREQQQSDTGDAQRRGQLGPHQPANQFATDGGLFGHLGGPLHGQRRRPQIGEHHPDPAGWMAVGHLPGRRPASNRCLSSRR